jgi:phage terminase large subunit-like protein
MRRPPRSTSSGLRIVDVAGRPTMGEACKPWAIDFAAAIFGSL